MSPDGAALPDAAPRNLAARLLPPALLPYVQLARWDRPIGWQLLLVPCWWSSALASDASHHAPNLWHLLLYFIGAVAMRGAGSTYNDIVDRKIDAHVERTRLRPLPSGRIRVRDAKIFLTLQSLVGLAVLLCFNPVSIGLGIASLAIVALYPFMKRVTSWPQFVLGLAFAWGALMGWAGIFGGLAPAAFALYAAAIAWTIGYDTIYALQDTRDDAIIGVRSTARLFAGRVRQGVGAFYGLAVAAAGLALALAGAGALAWIGLAAFAAHLAWQIARIDAEDGARALELFRANWRAGLLLFAGIAAEAGWRAAMAWTMV